MHNNIAAYKAAVLRHVTAVIPWHGQNPELLQAALQSLPAGLRVIIAKNAGKHEMAGSLNLALSQVKTKYTFVMGSDDIVDKDMLWRLWEAAIDHDGAYPWMLGFGADRFRFPAEPWCPLRLQDANICGVFLIKTRVLREVGGWTDTVVEDWDLMYRVGKAGARLAPAPRARYGYRQRHEGLHRSTVREARELELTWADLAPCDPSERVPVPAVFYPWKYDGTGYVRCEVASRTARSVVRMTFDQRDAHEAKSWVYQYPNEDAQVVWDLAAKMGKRRVIDVDDNYLAETLGSVVGSYHKENGDAWAERQESHKRMCEEADYIICATPNLADVYRKVNPNVVVCENSVDPADWPSVTKKKRIVGIVLSANHRDHVHLVEEAARYASMQKNTEVQVIGLDPEWDFAYTHFMFTPSVASYRRVLSRWSLGLAPVIDNEVTRCKSDLKWLEYTMCGAALVCSDVEAYRRVPDGCVLRAASAADFADATRDVLSSESRRRALVKASAFHVKRDRTVGNESLRSRYNTALAWSC